MTNAPMPTVAVQPRRPVPEQVDRHLAELVVRWARQWADRRPSVDVRPNPQETEQ
jgi:hypothetical protein